MTTPIYQVKADFFKTLGHPARIRILEILRDGERMVSELIPEVGIEASHLSQQLGVMRRANLIQSRKVGSNVLYSVGDPTLFELLEVAKRIIRSSLAETQELLDQMSGAIFAPTPDSVRSLHRRRNTEKGARPRFFRHFVNSRRSGHHRGPVWVHLYPLPDVLLTRRQERSWLRAEPVTGSMTPCGPSFPELEPGSDR